MPSDVFTTLVDSQYRMATLAFCGGDSFPANYMSDTLLSVVQFGGHGFVKIANSTPSSSMSGLASQFDGVEINSARGSVASDEEMVVLERAQEAKPKDSE